MGIGFSAEDRTLCHFQEPGNVVPVAVRLSEFEEKMLVTAESACPEPLIVFLVPKCPWQG